MKTSPSCSKYESSENEDLKIKNDVIFISRLINMKINKVSSQTHKLSTSLVYLK